MSVLSISDYAGSLRQQIHLNKVGAAITNCWQSGWIDASAGSDPAVAGVVVLSTPNGAVPTNLTTGAPSIQPFSGIGYVSRIDVQPFTANTGRAWILDRLFECGSFAWNSGLTTLTGQPSFSSRVPGGNYSGLRLMMEQGATSGSGPATLTITYTDQSGNAGHSTTYTVKPNGGAGAGACLQTIALAAGDSGIQMIESVTTSGGSSGNFNLLICRDIASVGVPGTFNLAYPPSFVLGMETLGLRRVYSDSCLMTASSGASLDLLMEVVSG